MVNLDYFGRGEFGEVGILSQRPIAPLGIAVGHVVGWRAKKQVGRVHAVWPVALVADVKAGCGLAVVIFKRDAMSRPKAAQQRIAGCG